MNYLMNLLMQSINYSINVGWSHIGPVSPPANSTDINWNAEQFNKDFSFNAKL